MSGKPSSTSRSSYTPASDRNDQIKKAVRRAFVAIFPDKCLADLTMTWIKDDAITPFFPISRPQSRVERTEARKAIREALRIAFEELFPSDSENESSSYRVSDV